MKSRVTSIFFLTSIFNNSIHSSIAVFQESHSMKMEKGRIEQWQPRKKVEQRKRAEQRKRSNSPSHCTTRGRESVPLTFVRRHRRAAQNTSLCFPARCL